MRTCVIGGAERHFQGWKPDIPDHRDLVRPMMNFAAVAALPKKFTDMQIPWDTNIGIYDQGNIGSCTAHGVVEIYRWDYWRTWYARPIAERPTAPLIPDFSRLAQYAATRILQGTPLTEDSGCMIRDAVKTAVKTGLAPEAAWPYTQIETRFTQKPPAEVFRKAELHQVLTYHRVPNLAGIKQEVLNWRPVIFGFTCYDSLSEPKTVETGLIPIPEPREQSTGGHCMVICGWDDTLPVGKDQNGRDAYGAVLCPNSWGRSAGKAGGLSGWFWLPYWYFKFGQAMDFWVVDSTEQPEIH